MERLIKFLENKTQGDGWEIRQGLDSLGNPPQEISDVYIAYVLSKKRDWSDNKFVSQFKSLDKLAADFKKGT